MGEKGDEEDEEWVKRGRRATGRRGGVEWKGGGWVCVGASLLRAEGESVHRRLAAFRGQYAEMRSAGTNEAARGHATASNAPEEAWQRCREWQCSERGDASGTRAMGCTEGWGREDTRV